MGNPLKAAEDMIELEEKGDILNSLLRIVTFLCNRYAMGASSAALIGAFILQLKLIKLALNSLLILLSFLSSVWPSG
jgi:hypothetical protein